MKNCSSVIVRKERQYEAISTHFISQFISQPCARVVKQMCAVASYVSNANSKTAGCEIEAVIMLNFKKRIKVIYNEGGESLATSSLIILKDCKFDFNLPFVIVLHWSNHVFLIFI